MITSNKNIQEMIYCIDKINEQKNNKIELLNLYVKLYALCKIYLKKNASSIKIEDIVSNIDDLYIAKKINLDSLKIELKELDTKYIDRIKIVNIVTLVLDYIIIELNKKKYGVDIHDIIKQTNYKFKNEKYT